MKNSRRKDVCIILRAACFLVMFFVCAVPYGVQAAEDVIKVAMFEQDLANLAPQNSLNVQNILDAKDLFFSTFTEADSRETREAAFLVFYKYYLNIAENSYNDPVFDDLNDSWDEEHVKRFRDIAATYGLQIIDKGEAFDPEPDPNYIVRTFANYISPALKGYFAFQQKTMGYLMEGYLTISYEELRQRIILGDTVAQKFPAVAPMVKEELDAMVYFYLFDVENQAWSDGHAVIQPELKKSYENFLASNKQSTFYPLIKFTYDLLEKNKFRITEDIESQLRDKFNEEGLSL